MIASPVSALVVALLGSLMPRSGEIAHWTSVYVYSGVATEATPLLATLLGTAIVLLTAGGLYARSAQQIALLMIDLAAEFRINSQEEEWAD